MQFPFVLKSRYRELESDLDCYKWSAKKQLDQYEKLIKGLTLRVNAAEEYAETLENKISDLMEDNRTLLIGRDNARQRAEEAEKKVRELTLINGSLEAMWGQKQEPGEEDNGICDSP